MVTDKTSDFQTEKVKSVSCSENPGGPQSVSAARRLSAEESITADDKKKKLYHCLVSKKKKVVRSTSLTVVTGAESIQADRSHAALLHAALRVFYRSLLPHHSLCSALILTLDLWSLQAVMLLFLHCSVDMTQLKQQKCLDSNQEHLRLMMGDGNL